MAENDIVLGLAIDTQKGVASLNSFHQTATKVFGAVAAAAAAAFLGGKLISGIDAVIDSANQQVDAITKMNQSLAASGEYSKAASESMQDYAKALSDVVAIDDDEILNGIALAKSFGTTNEQAKALVTTAIDLAATMGTDLNSAITQLGGTLSGSAGRLSKISPQLKNISEEALKSGAAIKILGERFKGAAESAAGTFSGEIKKAALSFDDLKTSIGLIITQNPAIRVAIKAMSDIFNQLTKSVDGSKTSISLIISNGFVILVKSLKITAVAFAAFAEIVQTVLKPITGTISVLGKGMATLGFVTQTAANILQGLTSKSKEGQENLQELVDTFEALDKLENFDVSSLVDGLAQTAFNFADDIEKGLESITLDKPIPITVQPIIDPGTVIDLGTATFGFPTNADFKLPEQVLPGAGPVTPTDQQTIDANKPSTTNDTINQVGSGILGALEKGGYAGAQAAVATAATAIASIFPATAPFAGLIGELVTFVSGDGPVLLIKNLADHMDEVAEALAKNTPMIAVAIVKMLGSVKFWADIINGIVNGAIEGTKEAFKEAGPGLMENIIEPLRSAFVDIGDNFSALWGAITSGIGAFFAGIFSGIGAALSYIVNGVTNAFDALFNLNTDNIARAVVKMGDDIATVFKDTLVEIEALFVDGWAELTKGFTDLRDKFIKLGDDFVAIFDDLFLSIRDFITTILGGKTQVGKKVGDFFEDPVGSFSLTGDTGTVQHQNQGFALTSSPTQDVSTALLGQILVALNNPLNVKSTVTLDGRAMADIILELSRRNARLVA